MWKLIPPHIWAAICVTGWGIVASCQAATTSFGGMMAARFFLGVFEAGYGPGIPFLLSFFYLRHEIGFRIGIFLSAAPLATCFAGALAYGITSGNDAHRIKNWRLLFLVEGLPCIIAGIATYFALPDNAEKATFLSEEEKQVAKARGVRQVGDEEDDRIGHISIKDVGFALLDLKVNSRPLPPFPYSQPKIVSISRGRDNSASRSASLFSFTTIKHPLTSEQNYFTALMYFSCNVSFSSLPVFLPTILSEMGFSDIQSQGLSAPPYFLAFLLTIGTTYIADRTQQRGLTIIVLSLIGASGYILLAATSATGPRYTGVFLAAAGIFPCIGNILPWVLNNQGSDTKRGTGIAILNLVGQCGPLLGTRIYPGQDSPYYRMGMWVCAGFMLFNGLLALLLRILLAWENKVLDEKFGVVARVDGNGYVDGKEEPGVGDENDGPRFRYVL